MTMTLSESALNKIHPRLRQTGFAQQLQLAIDLIQELKADVNTVIAALNVLAATTGKLALILNAQQAAIAASEYATTAASVTSTAPDDLA